MSRLGYKYGVKYIWNSLNSFRNTFSATDYGVFLYYIHAYKSGFLKYYNENETISVEEAIKHALFDDNCNYPIYEHELFRIYYPLLNDISHADFFANLHSQLKNLDDEWLHQYEAQLFDDLIDGFIESAGRYGEVQQQLELTKFIASICPYKGDGILYNPFAGTASYGTEISGKGKYFGQEINQSTWAIGVMRLLAHGKDAFDFTCQNSIKDWASSSSDKELDGEKYDCIISTPPFGLKIDSNDIISNGINRNRNYQLTRVEDFLISKCLNSLTDSGTAVLVLPQWVAFMGNQSYELRKQYIQEDKLDSVVLLPSGAFPKTTIATVILLFSNKKENPGYVRMVDGSEFVHKTSTGILSRNKVLYDQLLKAIAKPDKYFVKQVSNDEISNNDFIILPSQYTHNNKQIPDGFERFKLSEIADVINGLRCTRNDTFGKVISRKMLSENPFEHEINVESIQASAISRQPLYRKIDTDVILLSRLMLRPTYVHANKNIPVYIDNDLIAIKVSKPNINIDCLILSLTQSIIPRFATTIQRIPLAFIENIQLDLPNSYSAQEAYYNNARQAYQMAKIKELGLEEIVASQKRDFIAVLRRRKHDINSYVGDIRNRIQGLNKYLINNGIDKEVYSQHQNTTVGDNLKTIIDKLNEMGKYLEHIADENDYGQPQKVDLCNKLREIKDGPNYKVELIFDESISTYSDTEDEEKHAYINIAPLDLEHVFLNIINNASKHGFTEPESKDYRIEIILVYDQEENEYEILFRNNGKPLPEGMNTERYGTPGEKAGRTQGNGEGGAIIKETIEHFGGHISIISAPEEQFPVTIKINIPCYDRD